MAKNLPAEARLELIDGELDRVNAKMAEIRNAEFARLKKAGKERKEGNFSATAKERLAELRFDKGNLENRRIGIVAMIAKPPLKLPVLQTA